jgi:DNA polymerase III sliding clamp (beta) subunit (PCNA family)
LLSFDLDKKIIQAKSELGLRSNRKIAIDNIATNEDTQELSIRCNTNYIKDVINQADDEDHIQIEIEDESMPVIIRHYAAPDFRDPLTLKKPNDDGIQERYSEFFATLKKN